MAAGPDYLPRHLDAALVAAVSASPVVILDGARAVGKTTTARRLATSVIMLPRDLEALRVDPQGYLSALPPPILIDEWQLAGVDLLWTVKRIVDDDPAPGRFLLTGSVEPAAYGPTYPLTGRAVRLVMRPMTVAELRGSGAKPNPLAELTSGAGPELRPASTLFELDLLTRPGFPAARHLPDSRLFLDAYTAVVSQRAGEAGRDATRLLRALRVLATLSGQAVPEQRIWEAADINKATWKQYDDLLTRAHLSVPSPAWESNRLKRLTTYPKRFLADTAMALALVDLTVEDLRLDPTLAGPFFESFVMQQLRPQVDALGGAVSHVRTGAGEHEVDVVIELGSGLVAVEVKLGTHPSGRDLRQLDWLRDHLGKRFHRGFVVHTGTDTYPLGDRIWALPVTRLAVG